MNFLSPGIFIEETTSDVQVTQGVSTGNVGVVGYTPMGPTNTPTLIGSYAQFEQTFGGLSHHSWVGYNVAAFFANGGSVAYVVRVLPSDAVAASSCILDPITNQVLATGDGSTTSYSATSTTTTLVVNSGASPVQPSTVTLTWRKAGSPLTASVLTSDGSTAIVGDATTTKFSFRVATAAVPAFTPGLWQVVPSSATFKFTHSASPVSVVLSAPAAGKTWSSTTSSSTTVIFDFATGIGSVTCATAPDAASHLTLDFTPASVNQSVSDNGAGVIPAGSVLSAPGSITYATGAYSFAPSTAPHLDSPILITYTIQGWTLAPISKGLWGDNLRTITTGASDSYVPATASYSKVNVNVLLADSNGNYSTVETYEDLVVSPSTDPSYFADVINALSDYVTVAEPAGNVVPGDLNGVLFTQVVGSGNDAASSKTFAFTIANAPLAPFSISLTYTATGGTVYTITDDGEGNLIGTGVAASGTVNYTTGVFSFSTAYDVGVNTLATLTYATAPAVTQHVEDFGDTTKGYTEGSDGTFTANNYGEGQLTSVELQSTYSGVYALNKVEDIMAVIVPDLAGSLSGTSDLLTYAANRAEQNSGGDRFIILTVPQGSTSTQAANWFRYTLAQFSDFAALYWPWIQVTDALSNGRAYTVPPLGHIAGIYARTASTKNVGKTPAGTVDGALNFLVGLERNPTQTDRDLLYPLRINPLINTPQTGLAVWGGRTISSTTTWRYINARLLFMFVERSVYNSTQWVVFENNGPALWARIQAQLNGFLSNLFSQGYFAGTQASDAYFVTCDRTNNSQASIDQGIVNITVGIAANRPAEFAVFAFQQLAS